MLGLAVLLGVAVGPVRAADPDPFSATVSVDASGDTIAKAREAARLDGQRRALQSVLEQQAGAGGNAKMPKLDDQAISDLVASFEVADERMSAVRYLADYTFHFRPDGVRRLLRNAGVAAGAGEQSTKPPAVVVPVWQAGDSARLWEDPNPWRAAWDAQMGASGAARLAMPLGDAGDLAAIDADKAVAGNPEALAGIAKRNGGDDTVVALAKPQGTADRPSGVDVTVRRYRAGHLVEDHKLTVSANPGEGADALLRRSAGEVVAQIGSGWKKQPPAHYDQQGSLTAILPIDSLEDWLRARDRLAGVSGIRNVSLVALSRKEATIEIGYLGSIDQLKASLAEISLDLVPGEKAWRLAHSAPRASSR